MLERIVIQRERQRERADLIMVMLESGWGVEDERWFVGGWGVEEPEED